MIGEPPTPRRPAGPDPGGAPEDGRRLRWTEHRAQRRAAFVAAGAAAIDRFGPGASAEQIAEEAGISRTVLYRYFRDREDLRHAIAEQVVADLLAGMRPELAISPASTAREVISAAVGEVVGWLDEHPNLYHFLRSRRAGASLDSVESTVADRVAGLLKAVLVAFGVDGEQAEPGAYGIVGFVESCGAWWLGHRAMPRERFTEIVTAGVWHLLDGTAREFGIELGFDDPLPLGSRAAQEA